ncbi:MAG: hypothetical protein PHS04_12690 [Tissierellia bacterium]|nr:hypothetical protein [Tissierellia bacterium]
MSRSIKNYDTILSKFVFFNILIILIVMSLVNIKNYVTAWDILQGILFNGIGLTTVSILAILLNGVLKTDYKNLLIFWKSKHSLPSYFVFSKLSKKDDRIDFDELSNTYAPLPEEPELQHRLWYKILKKYPDDEMILQSHRDYLMYRDLTAILFLLIVLYIVIFIIMKLAGVNILSLPIIVYMVEYFLLVISTRNKAERFVLNVIACDLSQKSISINE